MRYTEGTSPAVATMPRAPGPIMGQLCILQLLEIRNTAGCHYAHSMIVQVFIREVWEAHPTLMERRNLTDRRGVVRGEETRRLNNGPPIGAHGDGWLVFRSENQRRRQRPIPPA